MQKNRTAKWSNAQWYSAGLHKLFSFFFFFFAFAFNIQVIIQRKTLTFSVVLQKVKLFLLHTFLWQKDKSHSRSRLPSNAQKEFSLQQTGWPLNKTVSSTVKFVPKELLFIVKQNKPSSVPYLISEGQTPCPAAPPLSGWRNCLLQMGSTQTYPGDCWRFVLGSWKQTLCQRKMICRNWMRKMTQGTL